MEIKPFTRTEKIIVFFACALGWAHDAIGLTLITALAEPIQLTFGVPVSALGFVMSAQFIATVPGAIIFGVLADRMGRKNILLLSIAWDAILTGLSAFSPNYIIFALLRILSGLGVSWGIAFALLGEVYSPNRRATWGGFVHAMFIIGFVGVLLITLILEPVLAPIFAINWWRPVFLIALIPLPFIVILYFFLPESQLWLKYQELESAESVPMLEQIKNLARSGYLRLLLICILLFWAAEFVYHAYVDLGVLFINVDLGFGQTMALLIFLVIATILFFVFPIIGYIGDKIGRRKGFMVPAFFGLIGTVVFAIAMFVLLSPIVAVAGLFILALGFSSHGLFGVWTSEIFPTSSRAAAASFIFSSARAFALGATIVGILVDFFGWPMAQAMLLGSFGFILMLILPWLLPETKGKELEPI
ncbi:MAG: MFS transporter [Candidatus Thorarchaeota archaeon]